MVLISSNYFIGGVLSSIIWGIAADAYGRKNILLGSLIADSFVCLLASISQSYTVLLIFRTISGFTYVIVQLCTRKDFYNLICRVVLLKRRFLFIVLVRQEPLFLLTWLNFIQKSNVQKVSST